MKKISISTPGSYDKIKFIECEDSKPNDHEVAVRVLGIGVNYADCLVRFGVYKSAKKYVGWPITPGFEFSGIVAEVGSMVKRWKKGDNVFGITRFNAYATRVVVDESQIFGIPAGEKIEPFAGFPVIYFTAFHAIAQLVRIYPNSKLLIHSAAGGVGSALVKIGNLMGHQTTGIIGSIHKKDYLQSIGCHNQIVKTEGMDLKKSLLQIEKEGFDAVFDANGFTTLKLSYEVLKPTGKLICYGSHSLLPRSGGRLNYFNAILGLLRTPHFNPLDMITENKTLAAFNISFLFERKDLIDEISSQLNLWIAEGKLTPIDTTYFHFEDCATAHRLIESGKSVGKIVLTT